MAMLNNQRVITNKPGDSRLNVPICKQNDRLWTRGPSPAALGDRDNGHPVHWPSSPAWGDELKRKWTENAGDFMGFHGIYVDLCGLNEMQSISIKTFQEVGGKC